MFPRRLPRSCTRRRRRRRRRLELMIYLRAGRQAVTRRRQATPRSHSRSGSSARPLIEVDLHMHTDHSYDCAHAEWRCCWRARASSGLGRDRGDRPQRDLRRARRPPPRRRSTARPPVKVIVGEEVKTAGEGEVIMACNSSRRRSRAGSRLRGDRRRDQPPGRGRLRAASPSTGMHSVPDYEHLLDDPLTTRSTRSRSSTRASRSAPSTTRLHALPRSTESSRRRARTRTSRRGSARSVSACATSTGRRSSCSRCATRDILTRPSSLLYVQALKFLQTRASPPSARRASKARRLKRLGRAHRGGGHS